MTFAEVRFASRRFIATRTVAIVATEPGTSAPMPAKSEPALPPHDAPRRRDPAAPRHLVGERAHLQSSPEDVQRVGERLCGAARERAHQP